MGSSTACCAISGTQSPNEAALISTSANKENVVSAEQQPKSEVERNQQRSKLKMRSTEKHAW